MRRTTPSWTAASLVIVSGIPSFKQKWFVAVSVEFSVARGASYIDRITVVTCPVLLEPDDKAADLERKASQAFDRYNNVAAGLAKGGKAVKQEDSGWVTAGRCWKIGRI